MDANGLNIIPTLFSKDMSMNSQQESRRDFLKMTATGLAVAGFGQYGAPYYAFGAEETKGFKYKVAFGAWINDMRNTGMPGERWPYLVLDDELEKDIINCLKLQSESGYNMFTAWGLMVTNAWPPDIVSAVPEERKERVNRIIQAAHDYGIKVLCGVGIYSWGYEEIIKNDPEVAGTNPNAMCASKDASWEYVKKIIDYTFTEFPELDGLHMESADLGGCECEECKQYGRIEYHARINAKTADYVREKFPGKIIMASSNQFWNSGGLSDPDKERLEELSKHLDFFIVPYLSFRDKNQPNWFENFSCEFGGSGDFWVYTPQQWERLRWFLPYPAITASGIRQLYDAGGRAIEFYMGPTINPGTEFNIVIGGKMLCDPHRNVEDVALEAVEMLYAPRDRETGLKLSKIFFDAEKAYMSNNLYFRNGDWWLTELCLTGLWGPEPGPPYYLTTSGYTGIAYMNAEGRKAYKEVLEDILGRLDEIENNVGNPEKVQRIRTCINNVILDLNQLGFEPE